MLEAINDEKFRGVLERIAVALERIVEILEVEEVAKSRFGSSTTKIREEKRDGINTSQVDEFLLDFLNQRGVEVRGFQPVVYRDPKFDKLAMFMGDRFENLKDFLKFLRRYSQNGEEFTVSLRDYPPEAISDICQLCHNMKSLGYLKDYRYSKSPKRHLSVKTIRDSSVQNFLDGKWLQRYILKTLDRAKNRVTQTLGIKLDIASITNLKVVIDDMETELYHLFRVNNETFLIEAKLGEHHEEDIEKFKRISEALQLGDNVILILAELNSRKHRSNVYGMPAVRLSYLEQHLANEFTKFAAKLL
ncbi:MAG: hypothetical protein PWP37_1359 [Thermotogota bacterium]|nr:hypothetical protein [Thermotogota bacterium]HCZ07376.1 hypothetical protein [Thermotogota bacterium]